MTALPVSATDSYTYTVTFYAGNQGTFASASGLTVTGRGQATVQNNGARITVSGLQAGDMISFDTQQGASGPEMMAGIMCRYRPSARDNDQASLSARHFE